MTVGEQPVPTFLVIGAIKAGTTSLYHYLKQHPDVFMSPRKEAGYFAVDFDRPLNEGFNRYAITDVDTYRALFAGVTNEHAVGEASPQYLWSPLAPAKIAAMLPNVRLIALLRNPIDRAFSSYLHLRREGGETIEDFGDALRAEGERVAEHLGPLWRYQEVGLYARQLERYHAHFDRAQIKIFLYDDFSADPRGVLRSVFRFIGVDDEFVPDMGNRYNVSGIPRSRALHRVLNARHPVLKQMSRMIPTHLRERVACRVRAWNVIKPALSEGIRAQLVDLYREDILRTQECIGRDLSMWLDPSCNHTPASTSGLPTNGVSASGMS